jgi:hypothetical protein
VNKRPTNAFKYPYINISSHPQGAQYNPDETVVPSGL